MSILKTLENYCIGTAESELSFLRKTFVDDQKYHDILLTPAGSPTIMVGKKGSGKTAVLQYINKSSESSNSTSLYLKPDDIPLLSKITDQQDLANLKRLSYEAIIDCLAIKLGSEIRGLITNSEKRLFDKAVSSGKNHKDIVQLAMKGLAKFGSAISDINFDRLLPEQLDSNNQQLVESVKENFSRNRDKCFFLLLDDIDQVASPGQSNQINRIWAFILAAKKFAETFPNSKCIISIRAEVLNQLLNDKQGQRDQHDHISMLTTDLDPTEDQIKKIVTRRLNFVKDQVGAQIEDPIDLFFEERSVTLPTSEEKRSWVDYISKTSRARPRDAIQFLGLLAKKSNGSSLNKISNKHVNDASYSFSKSRVSELSLEYAPESKDIEQIIKSMARIDFRIETDELKNFLNTIPSSFNLHVRGKLIHQDNVDEIFMFWNFLHELEVVNPCVKDSRETRDFRHIRYKDDKNFVAQSNWNNMQKVIWEIHPAYRSFLLKIKEDEMARKGITFKKFFQNTILFLN